MLLTVCDCVLHVDYCLLHVSWLTVVLSRIFEHTEAKSIISWGVQECLTMPLQDSPLLQLQNWQVRCRTLFLCSFQYLVAEFLVCVWPFASSAELIHDL